MSTLADVLMASKGGAYDRVYQGGITRLADDVEKAEKFVFSADATKACDKLSEQKPSSLVDATRFCRLPFKNVWMEWDPSRNQGRETPNWLPKADGTIVPKKIGCLATCFDDTNKVFGVTLVWENNPEDMGETLQRSNPTWALKDYKKEGRALINVCPLGYVLNWYSEWPMFDTIRRQWMGEKPMDLSGMWIDPKWRNNDKEKQALLELFKNGVQTVSPYCTGYLDNLTNSRSHIDMQNFWKTTALDWTGEYSSLIARMCLLNSKNCIETKTVEFSKLNKQRKKSGKLPLLSHKAVTINLSRRDADYAKANGVSPSEIRQHIVRGHFKIKKHGVYWWRPFMRGDAEVGVIKRTGYKVIDSPSEIAA